MIDQASVPSLMGSTVRDSAGEKIGKVGQVYLPATSPPRPPRPPGPTRRGSRNG
jgi:hypothetical protein